MRVARTVDCRICDLCGKILDIYGVESMLPESINKVKNLEEDRYDEICDDCLNDETFTCDGCGDEFYNTDKFECDGEEFCPDCAESKMKKLEETYFDFVTEFKKYKKERNEVRNDED